MNILKKLWHSIATRFIPQMLAVSLKRKHSQDYITYMKHVENTTGSFCERWLKVFKTIGDPMVILPVVFGFLLLLSANSCDKLKDYQPIIIAISTFAIGIGVNHFSTIFKEQTEYKKLVEKAEFTVRTLNNRINSILRKRELSDIDRDNIEALLMVMDYWKSYYAGSDTAKISYHRKLIKDIKELEALNNPDNKHKIEELKSKTEEIEMEFSKNGVDAYLSISGNSIFNTTIFVDNIRT